MEREQLEELHYITHVDNMPSICSLGVLSNRGASRVGHKSVADPEVQERRKRKRVPSGLLLHDYANLYVTARNPMLYKRIRDGQIDELCVVQISTTVLDLDGVVVTDRNAAKFGCGFKSPSEGIDGVDGELLVRTYWGDGDALERERCWDTKFTEVLVPNLVPPPYLEGIYVGTDIARSALESHGLPLAISENSKLFFNHG
jgi:hypothetical protein